MEGKHEVDLGNGRRLNHPHPPGRRVVRGGSGGIPEPTPDPWRGGGGGVVVVVVGGKGPEVSHVQQW